MKKLERLKRQHQQLGVQIRDLEDEEWDRKIWPKLQKLVGSCWKYRNCYSMPKGPQDYWWAYRRITKVQKDGPVFVSEFQTDSYGEIRFKVTEEVPRRLFREDGFMGGSGGWQRCGLAEWERELELAKLKLLGMGTILK